MIWIAIKPRPRKSSAVRVETETDDPLATPQRLAEGALRLDDSVGFGGKSLRKEKTRLRALATMFGNHLVLDRALAKKVLGKLGDDVVRLRPAPLHDKKGLIDSDYVLVDVRARVPLDRASSTATYSKGGPEKGLLDALTKAAWSDDRRPRVPIFRLLDRPELLFVSEAIATALGDSVVVDDFSSDDGQWLPDGYELGHVAPLVVADAKAEAAFWRAYAGKAKDRAAALGHPFWALATAIAIDGKPADDTRAAASKSPVLAARYAIEVDRGGHDVTRKSANTDGVAVLYYAQAIDFELSPAARKLILKAGNHDKDTLAGLEVDLRARRQGTKQGVAIAGDWPKKPPPRYREVAKPTTKLPRIEALDAALRSDIDAFVLRGYARLGLPKHDDDRAARPEEVVNRVFAAVGKIQAGGEKLTAKTRGIAAMELGCAWGEQLRRTLGWQWAYVHYEGGKGIALVSPDLALCHYPLAMLQAHIAPKRKENTLALLFNMATSGDLPKSKKGALASVQ